MIISLFFQIKKASEIVPRQSLHVLPQRCYVSLEPVDYYANPLIEKRWLKANHFKSLRNQHKYHSDICPSRKICPLIPNHKCLKILFSNINSFTLSVNLLTRRKKVRELRRSSPVIGTCAPMAVNTCCAFTRRCSKGYATRTTCRKQQQSRWTTRTDDSIQ